MAAPMVLHPQCLPSSISRPLVPLSLDGRWNEAGNSTFLIYGKNHEARRFEQIPEYRPLLTLFNNQNELYQTKSFILILFACSRG